MHVELAARRAVEFCGVVVVERDGELLVAHVLVEVVVLELCALARCNDPSHEFHGGVVLARVFLFIGFHHDLRHHRGILLELDNEAVGGALGDADGLALVAHGGDGERPSHVAVHGESAVDVGLHALVVILIDDVCHGYCLARLGIEHLSRELLSECARGVEKAQQKNNECFPDQCV